MVVDEVIVSDHGSSARSDRRWRWVPLAAVTALGAFVCFFKLPVATFGVDEGTYADAGWAYVHGDFSANVGHPLLAKELLGIVQLVFGRDLWSLRLLGATCGFLTGLVLYDLGRRLAGQWAGLAVGILWFALPQAPGTSILRLDRFAVLEPLAILLGMVGLWCGARWLDDPRRAWMIAAGVAVGLSASAKMPGASYGVALVAVVVAAAMGWGAKARLLALTIGSAGVAFVVPYLFAGNEAGMHLRAIFSQVDHAEEGHPQLIAGVVRAHHPWWSNFWWQQTYLGWAAVVALWVLAVIGVVAVGRAASRALLAGGIGGPLLFLTVSPLKLPHYHVLLVAPLLLGAGIGLVAVLDAPLHLARSRRAPVAVGAALVVAVLAVPAIQQQYHVARLRRSDYQLVIETLDEAGLSGGAVAVWGWGKVLTPYLPEQYVAGDVFVDDPVALVLDPVTADRQRDSDAARRVAELIQGHTPIPVDRLDVYVLSES